MPKDAERALFIRWLATHKTKRVPSTRAQWARDHKVSTFSLKLWKKSYDEGLKAIGKNPDEEEPEKEETFDELLKSSEISVLKNALVACADGKPKAMEAIFKMAGRLVERSEQEVHIELSAGDYIKTANKVVETLRQSIREHGGRCPLCGGFQALPELRLPPGQDIKTTEDGKVGELAVST